MESQSAVNSCINQERFQTKRRPTQNGDLLLISLGFQQVEIYMVAPAISFEKAYSLLAEPHDATADTI